MDRGAIGVEPLWSPKDAIVDIVFIHGLNGNRELTWTNEAGLFWPKDLLPNDIPQASILTWGYDANVLPEKFLGVISKNSIKNHAETFCLNLQQYRTTTNSKTKERPLILVAHSLGGLALLLSPINDTCKLSKDLYGIIFLGTPHRGTSIADLGAIVASLVAFFVQVNQGMLKELKAEALPLTELEDDFAALMRGSPDGGGSVKVVCLHEELPECSTKRKVVEPHSAVIPGTDRASIHACHTKMTKFSGPEDPGYKTIRDRLKEWVTDIRNQQAQDSSASSTAAQGSTFAHYGDVKDNGLSIQGNQTFSGSQSFGGTHTHQSG
ncbi:MAG: hypothetical protein M1820_005966 [Bogoriella megaspora]|nr:MAG: hypothetical protein M1820_005966 [Bogoriella megaspora]